MNHKNSVVRFGGFTLIIAGILLLAQYLFALPIPKPPVGDTELMKWIKVWSFNISMIDEISFFATIFMIPSIAALYHILVKVNKNKTIFGCGLLAASIPMNLFLVIILGRLVYPVYNLELSPDIHKLVISTYYGGMHMVSLMMSIATILLCSVIRKSVLGKLTAYVGFVVGIMDLVGSFPWLFGKGLIFVTQVLFAGWFVMVGVMMIRKLNEITE